MKKSKKEKLRPKFKCPECGTEWVSINLVYCMACGKAPQSIPMNEGAEKMINRQKEQNHEQEKA